MSRNKGPGHTRLQRRTGPRGNGRVSPESRGILDLKIEDYRLYICRVVKMSIAVDIRVFIIALSRNGAIAGALPLSISEIDSAAPISGIIVARAPTARGLIIKFSLVGR